MSAVHSKTRAKRFRISTEPLPSPSLQFKDKNGWKILNDTTEPSTISVSELNLIPIFKKKEEDFYREMTANAAQLNLDLGLALKKPSKTKLVKVDLLWFVKIEKKMKKKFGISLDRRSLIFQRARELDANLGERHARCLLEQRKSFPIGWRETRPTIVFPGTIWGEFFQYYPMAQYYGPIGLCVNRYIPIIQYDSKKTDWEISHLSVEDLFGLCKITPDDNIYFLCPKSSKKLQAIDNA